MTLREFLEEVNCHEHYRIYQPNRDCLIFESYFKVHSPYCFKDGSIGFNDNYWVDNDYCNDVRECKELDEETKIFLERFGDYKVIGLECSSFRPTRVYKDEQDELHYEPKKDPTQPHLDYINCFNIFII